jgi:hypothetical protein
MRLARFKDEVADLFDAKAMKASYKMGAEEMCEKLKAQYPKKFRLASTHDTRNETNTPIHEYT